MKKLVIILVFFASVASSLQAASQENKKDVIGEWKYEVPSAPYGYEKGVLTITEKEGQLAGEVKFSDGYKIELKKLTYTDHTFTFGLYIDYEYISAKAKIEGKKMTGTVKTPDGDMKFTAEKTK